MGDTHWFIEQRILGALVDLAGGGSGVAFNLGGVVDPEGVVTAVQWSHYTNSANQTMWIRESAGVGNTGWLQFI